MDQNSGDTLSRYELNRMVSGVLTRHGIDLQTLSLSSSASLVYLNGFLSKVTGQEMTATDVDIIFREIESIPRVRGIIADLENWVVVSADGRWQAAPKGRSLHPAAAAPAREDYRIDKEERIADVLEAIRPRNEDSG
jgi:hypothetical protein